MNREEQARYNYAKTQLSIPIKERDWKHYGSFENFKKAYQETLNPFIINGEITKDDANAIFKIVILDDKYILANAIRGIKVLLKNDREVSDTVGKLIVKIGKWCVYKYFGGGVNVLTIKTYR